MSLSTISITQGTGTAITVDTSAGGDMQVIKLAESALGSNSLVPASASTGLLVNIGTVSVGGGVPVTNAGGGNLNVAVVGTATISGSVSVTGTPSVAQSGTWNIGTVATITNPVTVTGMVSLSGTSPVSGTVTSNQGTAAAAAGAWPVKLTDTTNTITLQSVSGTWCLPVKVLAVSGGGYSQQDKTPFTEGTTPVEVIGGVYNDAFAGSPSAGQNSVVRITAQRAFHVNLRTAAGTEIGTAASPVAVQNQPSGLATGQTAWKSHVAYTASQTGQTIHAPASGKTVYVEGIVIQSSGAGAITVFDNTNSSTTILAAATLSSTGALVITPARPIPLSAVNNVLEYTTGSGAAGDITCWGYEA